MLKLSIEFSFIKIFVDMKFETEIANYRLNAYAETYSDNVSKLFHRL